MKTTEEEEVENTRLELGLGQCYEPKKKKKKKDEISMTKKPLLFMDLWFELCPNKNQEAKTSNNGHDSSGKSFEYSNGGVRKKLKLTKDQSTVLEDCFKSHSALNPAQKHALAEQLCLQQRQVEVWFQNRRARTKLKQTEEEYELLKKCCESLSQENRKLRKELQDLRKMKDDELLQIKVPNTSKLATCPSCEKIMSSFI